MSVKMKRSVYADMFGPTTGDRVRLADTDIIIEVEKDFTTYGEEVKFGGGKVIRDGMGQAQATNRQGAVDTVITNVLILDHWGVVKADVGLKDGYSRTLEEVGRQFQVTRERIRQIEAKALRKMRHPTRIRKLEGFIELPGA